MDMCPEILIVVKKFCTFLGWVGVAMNFVWRLFALLPKAILITCFGFSFSTVFCTEGYSDAFMSESLNIFHAPGYFTAF